MRLEISSDKNNKACYLMKKAMAPVPPSVPPVPMHLCLQVTGNLESAKKLLDT